MTPVLKYVEKTSLCHTDGEDLFPVIPKDTIWANKWNLIGSRFQLKKKKRAIATLADIYKILN